MMKSMTGYGKVSECLNGKNFEIEIRSLNGKTLDVSTKLPSNYKDKELDVRSLIASKLERGKVDFLMSYTIEDPAQEALKINESLLDAYYNKVLSLTQKYGFQADKNLIFTSLLSVILSVMYLTNVSAGSSSSLITSGDFFLCRSSYSRIACSAIFRRAWSAVGSLYARLLLI